MSARITLLDILQFIERTEPTQITLVVGGLEKTLILQGMGYHSIDIENSVLCSHKKIAECAVFTWMNLFVVVAKLE